MAGRREGGICGHSRTAEARSRGGSAASILQIIQHGAGPRAQYLLEGSEQDGELGMASFMRGLFGFDFVSSAH